MCVDATVGGGGHAEALLQRMPPGGLLVGLDRDPEALQYASRRLSGYGNAFVPVRGSFAELDAVLDRLGIGEVDAIAADLGVSSHQIDSPGRGFSFRADAPLDMRMDPSAPVSAAEIVNGATEAELARIIREYGEERFAGRIAMAIVRRRARSPIASTRELAELVESAIPAAARRHSGIHPATRTFQALRIAVNGELDALSAFLPAAIRRLRAGGRICVISYHSLEDRRVKAAFAEAARGCVCPPRLPVCVCGRTPQLAVLTRRPVRPSAEEVARNPRARSARARAAGKL